MKEKFDMDRRQKARETFTKLLEIWSDDIEVLIDLAQLVESTDSTKSLSLYERACELLRERENIEAPPEMVNNMGSLYMQLGNYERARECYEEAEAKLQDDIDNGVSEGASMLVTIRYNLARCLEHLCLFDSAETMYQSILRQKENYIDCYMRLGCLARDRGQIYESSVWFKEAMSVNQANCDAWTLIGNLHMAKHEWGPAQKKFEHILKMSKDDVYSLVALGNVWLETLFSPSRNRENDSKNMERALAMFSRAIRIQPKNMWAANGVGCILAFKQQWQEARDLFAQVREATADFFDVWVNIAHVYMETRQYVPAIQMYSNAMKKFNREHDSIMLMYLARAFYRAGKMQESRETLEKATVEAPDNVQVKFNHAFIMKTMALSVLKDVKATTEQVNGAMEDLKTAERILSYISRNRDDTLAGARLVSRTLAGEEARECGDLLKQAQTYLARARQQDEEEQRLRAKQDEVYRLLIYYLGKTISFTENWWRKKKSRGNVGRKKKGADGDEFVNDSSDMGDWQGEGDGEGGEKRRKDKASRKASRKRREKRIGGDGSGSDEETAKAERRRKKKEAADGWRVTEKNGFNLVKSRAFLSSDDDSSDGAPPPQPEDIEDSPRPPRITDSESDEDSEPKPRKKKPVMDSDDSGDESGSDAGSGSDDDAPARRHLQMDSDQSEESSPRKKKQIKSDSDSD
uniref:TPR_REGION domain-containing protein n=1 Tax=Heterorhabditis bacteriophora TaxID=37862 RepID=A0A1I7XTC8_HETBA